MAIRDLWLQKEVRDGTVEVSKIPGDKNPADLMTKALSLKEVEERLSMMSMTMRLRNTWLIAWAAKHVRTQRWHTRVALAAAT